MKKIMLALFCLLLASCGTFNLKVQNPQPNDKTQPPVSATTQPFSSTTVAPTSTDNTQPIFTPTAPQAEPITLTAIQMSDVQNGWGVESAGRIIKTNDGGGMWRDVTPFQGIFDSHGLFAFSNEIAWAASSNLGANNVVWRTQDGGFTWEASQPIPLGSAKYSPLSLQFPDIKHGWMLVLAKNSEQDKHAELYKSENGGKDWTLVSNLNTMPTGDFYLPEDKTSMAFFDDQTGWIGGGQGKDDPNQWFIPNTGNGGNSWGEEILHLPAQSAIHCHGNPLDQLAPGSIAVQITCTTPKDAKYLFRHLYYVSTRGEPTWRSWALTGDALSAYLLNAKQGWLMVTTDNPQMNQIMYTKDGGGEWSELSQVPWKQAQLDFVSDKLGWAIVGYSEPVALFRTENGGQDWIQVRPALFKP